MDLKINAQVLRQCRKQMGYTLDDVKGKVTSIEAMEAAHKNPTFNQLDTLADLYNVPRWVFVSDELPPEYRFAQTMPAFRQFAETTAEVFNQPKVRQLVARVERLRTLIIELREDADEPMVDFVPPEWSSDLRATAGKIRKWLGGDGNFEFLQWREKLEEKGVFVFMTSKHQGWSHIDKNIFRGLAIYHPKLPIIIINDSDAKKAQSFTLFHELGHLIKKESAIDDWSEQSKQEEKLCDKLAAEVLMPADQFLPEMGDIGNLEDVKEVAGCFKVSPYACLVRLRGLGKINDSAYFAFERELLEEYDRVNLKLDQSQGRPKRNRGKEALNQYGRIYANTLFQAYYSKEITLHKLCKAFDLKQASHVFDLRNEL